MSSLLLDSEPMLMVVRQLALALNPNTDLQDMDCMRKKKRPQENSKRKNRKKKVSGTAKASVAGVNWRLND